MPGSDYVFGYASLVALGDAEAVPGRLQDYRRFWGVAMNNWEGGEGVKHWLDCETGKRPRIRVAYLDLCERQGSTVNGLALPVDGDRLAALDTREINYRRVDVTSAFEPVPVEGAEERPARVFAYLGLDAARERCRRGVAENNAYVATVRQAFEGLGLIALAELDRTTDSCPFPARDLEVRNSCRVEHLPPK